MTLVLSKRCERMPILVSDTSVIIDLERGGVLESIFHLPFGFAVPDLLFSRELEGALGDHLLRLGLSIQELTPKEVGEAARLARAEPSLSVPDTFAYVLASSRRWALLTGDGGLRRVAVTNGIEVRGVLWLFDRLEEAHILEHGVLHKALSAIGAHPRCRLPRAEISRRLASYRARG